MYIHDFNRNYKRTILLIHPMLINAKSLKKSLVDRMETQDIRILIPDLSGHGKSKIDTYISSANEASIIHKYLIANGINKIRFAFGASLGSNIIFELLRYDDIQIDSVILEGANASENSIIKSFIYSKLLICIKNTAKVSENIAIKLLSLKYDRELSSIIIDELMEMSKESIKNMIIDYYCVNLPYLRRKIQKNLNFYYGTRDRNIKFSEKRLKSLYPKANFFRWPYFKHCEKLYKEPRSYAAILGSFL